MGAAVRSAVSSPFTLSGFNVSYNSAGLVGIHLVAFNEDLGAAIKAAAKVDLVESHEAIPSLHAACQFFVLFRSFLLQTTKQILGGDVSEEDFKGAKYVGVKTAGCWLKVRTAANLFFFWGLFTPHLPKLKEQSCYAAAEHTA